MTGLYCTSDPHQKDQSHKSIMFSTLVITASPHLTTLIKSFHTMAGRAENANVEAERGEEEEREDNVSLAQVKTLSLSLSPPRVMYGVRTCWIVVLFSA